MSDRVCACINFVSNIVGQSVLHISLCIYFPIMLLCFNNMENWVCVWLALRPDGLPQYFVWVKRIMGLLDFLCKDKSYIFTQHTFDFGEFSPLCACVRGAQRNWESFECRIILSVFLQLYTTFIQINNKQVKVRSAGVCVCQIVGPKKMCTTYIHFVFLDTYIYARPHFAHTFTHPYTRWLCIHIESIVEMKIGPDRFVGLADDDGHWLILPILFCSLLLFGTPRKIVINTLSEAAGWLL